MTKKEVGKCFKCVSELVSLAEIPHMIYRTYDKPELSNWYFFLLNKKSQELLDSRCISEDTYNKFLKSTKQVEKAIKKKTKPYDETEAILSILKSEAVADVVKHCTSPSR